MVGGNPNNHESTHNPLSGVKRVFHGGIAGLRPGDLITAGHAAERHVAGCSICASHAEGKTTAIDLLTPEGRVYVTSDREYARYYASRAVKGWLYVVEPIGEVSPSDEDMFPSWWCEQARVVSVYDRAVVLTHKQRRRLFERWGGTESEYWAMVRSVLEPDEGQEQ